MGSGDEEPPVARVHADRRGLRDAAVAAGGTHVALLGSATVDEWHRSLGGPALEQCHYVSVDDTVRGSSAAAGPRAVGGGVFISVVERPVSDPAATLTEALDGVAAASLVVDDPSFLLEDAPDPDGALDVLAAAAADAGAELHVGLPDDDAAAAAVARRFTPADEGTTRIVAEVGLATLREVDPTNFGYLRRHWREAQRGLEAVGMTYPQAKQVHAKIPDPETTPRTLGAALGALVQLGALGLWGDTVAANRYDLTAYDPERVAAIGEAIEALVD